MAKKRRLDLQEAVQPYVEMLRSFVCRELSAGDFEIAFTANYLNDKTRLSQEAFDVLDFFFAEVDAYTPDAEPGVDPYRLTADELRERAAALLRRAGFEVPQADD